MHPDIFIPLGESQKATTSDMAEAIQALVDSFNSSQNTHRAIIEILNSYEITWEY